MAKIRISENELSKLIKKSILKEINEFPVAGQKYTLADLLNKIDYNGNASSLISTAGNTENTPENWAKIIRGAAKNAAQKIAYEQIANQIESSITNHQLVAQGIKDPRNDVNNIAVGQTGRYDISGNLYSQIMQIAGGLAQAAGSTYSVRDFLQAAQNQGALKGQTENSIKNAINKQIKSAGVTLAKTNPSAYKKYSWVLQKWMTKNNPYRISEIRDALAAFGQVLNTSRNEIPTVMGLQKALNYFSIKDTKGRPFKVDGVIGDETSAALKNIGYKDIYEWKETITNYQKMHNVPPRPDGIVGDNTLKAFQASNLTNINQLSRYKPGNQQANVAQVSNNSANAISNNLNGANKVTMSESELKQIIHESIDSVLNESVNEAKYFQVDLKTIPGYDELAAQGKVGTDGTNSTVITAYKRKDLYQMLENSGFTKDQIVQGLNLGAAKIFNDYGEDLTLKNRGQRKINRARVYSGKHGGKEASEITANQIQGLQTTINDLQNKISGLETQLSAATENATKWKNAYTKLQTTNTELTKANQNLNRQIAAANQARTQNAAASTLNRQTTTAQVNTGIPGANNPASALNTNPQRTTAAGTTRA